MKVKISGRPGPEGLHLVLYPENDDEETLVIMLADQAEERGGLRYGGRGHNAERAPGRAFACFDAGSRDWLKWLKWCQLMGIPAESCKHGSSGTWRCALCETEASHSEEAWAVLVKERDEAVVLAREMAEEIKKEFDLASGELEQVLKKLRR